MAHKLPDLPYPKNALEPHIDAQTMEIHHGKHHAAYVNNVNTALEKAPKLANLPVEELITKLAEAPEEVRTAVRNNGGGHANHSLFWKLLGPNAGGEPTGEIGKAIGATFGSFAKFKEDFAKAAMGRFGSGWAWLSLTKDGKLVIESMPNQDNPLMEGRKPVLGLDVWEHAYYLKYQNRRADYVAAFWNAVNWKAVEEQYKSVRK